MIAGSTERRSEAQKIDLDIVLAQPDRCPVDRESARPQARIQHGKGAAQGGAGVRAIGFGPQERRERFAARRAAGHREIGEERRRLASVDGKGRTGHVHTDRPEESDRYAGAHDATVLRHVRTS